MIYSRTFKLADARASNRLGVSLAKALDKNHLTRIYFEGSIGAGKTTLVRALLRGLGVTGPVKSPTFSLLEPYDCEGFIIHHFDLYRLESPDELEYLGWRDSFAEAHLCCIEWAGRAGNYLPAPDVQITLLLSEKGRLAEACAYTTAGERLLKRLQLSASNNKQN